MTDALKGQKKAMGIRKHTCHGLVHATRSTRHLTPDRTSDRRSLAEDGATWIRLKSEQPICNNKPANHVPTLVATEAAAEVKELKALSTWVGRFRIGARNRIGSLRTLTLLNFRSSNDNGEGSK